MVGLDCTIIMHPQVWKCSGHYDLFHDFMVDCRESKKRYRHDQVRGRWVEAKGQTIFVATRRRRRRRAGREREQRALKFFNLRGQERRTSCTGTATLVSLTTVKDFAPGARARRQGARHAHRAARVQPDVQDRSSARWAARKDAAFLRPETAQGIFVNFKNVLRQHAACSVPFGIAQIGKSFRNEITPRNFTFRSREFEQMEIEFFCHPEPVAGSGTSTGATAASSGISTWAWPASGCGCASTTPDELSHYSCGTADIEYAFPFLPPGEFGELEGIAHRGDFDLRSHMEGKLVRARRSQLVVEMDADGKPRHRGSGKDLSYFDDHDRTSASCRTSSSRRPAPIGRRWPSCARPTRGRGARRERQAADARRDEVPSAAGADQGGRLPAGQEGRHAGGRPGDLLAT